MFLCFPSFMFLEGLAGSQLACVWVRVKHKGFLLLRIVVVAVSVRVVVKSKFLKQYDISKCQ